MLPYKDVNAPSLNLNVYAEIENLLDFAQQRLLLCPRDRLVARGRLYLFLQLTGPHDGALLSSAIESQTGQSKVKRDGDPNLHDIYSLTAFLMQWTAAQQLYDGQSVAETNLFLGNLMGQLMPLASQLEQSFWALYHKSESEVEPDPGQGPKRATDFFYRLSQDAAYIRNDRLKQNIGWHSECSGIQLEITVNLSKPEKDPKAIAAALTDQGQKPNSGYPKCALCLENEGYPGHLNWAPRFNHRVIELQLDGKDFALQYSPYLYYPEHSIVISKQHRPMRIDAQTFAELFDFVRQFPHYMVGSNADLPIVGGSILSHHHLQAGCYEFPMFGAPVLLPIGSPITAVTLEVLDWPLSCIKLSGIQAAPLLDLASQILARWRDYSDESIGILSQTDAPHNTITPILRQRASCYEFFLVLRNNRCTVEHPLGLFHPHAEIHHIKKENIGLIEVLGLAILPGRLKQEMQLMAEYLLQGEPLGSKPFKGETESSENREHLVQHLPWLRTLAQRKDLPRDTCKLQNFLQQQIAQVFAQGLAHCGVICSREGWQRFFQACRL